MVILVIIMTILVVMMVKIVAMVNQLGNMGGVVGGVRSSVAATQYRATLPLLTMTYMVYISIAALDIAGFV